MRRFAVVLLVLAACAAPKIQSTAPSPSPSVSPSPSPPPSPSPRPPAIFGRVCVALDSMETGMLALTHDALAIGIDDLGRVGKALGVAGFLSAAHDVSDLLGKVIAFLHAYGKDAVVEHRRSEAVVNDIFRLRRGFGC